MKKATLTILMATVVTTQSGFVAQANDVSLMRQGMRSCSGDISQFCSGVFPGGGRIAQCLLNRREQLSSSCSAFVEKTKSAQDLMFACQADTQRYCGDVRPGQGRIVFCLNEKRNKISKNCADALNKAEAALRP